MIVLEDLKTKISPTHPCILSIGNFDGVHLGHQQILKRMRALAGPKGTVCVITFSNHPSFVLPGKTPTNLIMNKTLKMKYLEMFTADIVYCVEFTLDLAKIPYDIFIKEIHQNSSFDHLVLGTGDAFGYRREGTEEKVRPLGNQLGFKVEYLQKALSEQEVISSRRIRLEIEQGHLTKAAALLGHPYVLEGKMEKSQLILDPHLCLPPNGEYRVKVESDDFQKEALATIDHGQVSLDISLPEKKNSLIFD